MTPVQAGMIYESSFAGQPQVNLEQVVLHLSDVTDPALMQAAWQRAVARHPALRMVMDWAGADGPRQRPLSPEAARITVAVEDWSADAAPEARLAALLQEDRAAGADVAVWPNWRLRLCHLAQGAVLIWTFPHALLDGRSFGRVLEEVFADFDAVSAGLPCPTPAPTPDPAAHGHLAAQPAGRGTRDFFAAHLAGFETANALGLGLTPDATPATSGKPVLDLALDPATTAALTARAASVGATLGTALNAAWGVVLARSSGQALAVFGTTRSGRHLLPEGADIVGCLINTLPLAVRIAPDQTLDQLLSRLRGDQLAMRPHEHCALTEIRAELGLTGAQPLFETAVIYEREALEHRLHRQGGLWSRRQVVLHEEGALPLTLAAYGTDALLLRLEYDPARIARAAAARYLAYLGRILRAMALAQPEARVADLEMLDGDELAAVQALAADPMPDDMPQTGILAAITAHALADPDRLAVIGPDGARLTYAALIRQSDHLAAVLAARGIGHGSRVALCLHRSARYVVAMLAVWKTGAAFLPLDPAYPPEALTHMLRDSGAALLIAQRGAAWMAGHPLMLLDDGHMRADPEAPLPPVQPPAHAAGDPAYVIYTSGTTGLPKGVVVPKGALRAHAAAARAWMGLQPADHVLQFTSLSFDVSLEEIVPTLMAGARLCLRPDNAAQDPRAFLAHVAQQRLTVLNLPTGFWQALLDDMELTGMRLPSSVRLVIAGGERVPPAALARWRAIAPDVRWLNGYGPTETTITAAGFDLAPGASLPEGEVPVGRPLAHARAYVLAPDHSLAPLGCRGELWLGGACVATGYLGRPDLTAERFLPDPHVPEGRMYRSGDLASWRADGQLMVAGRADRQIKLRGYRIEPAEIEQVLEGLEPISQAVVAVLDAALPSARLVAWVRPAQAGRALNLRALDAAIGALLPPQKRPLLVPVSDWPMRPGGKIDMARLPRPAPARAGSQIAASDVMTRAVVQQFSSLLGVPQVGADDDFFAIGGHSLLMMRLIGRIEAEQGQRLSVADLRANPTPRAIAALLSSGGGSRRSIKDCLVPIQPLGSQPPIYGVHVLGENGDYFQPLSRQMGPDQPILGLTVGLLDEFTPTGVAETAELYHRIIDQQQPHGPLSLMAVSLGAYVGLELAQRLLDAGRDVRMLVLLDAEGPGGRPRIHAAARLGAHLGKVMREGPLYGLRKLAHRWDDTRHRLEKLRLSLSARFGLTPGPTTTVERFVAANALAVQAYRPRPYTGRLTIVRAAENIFDSPAALASGLGWASVAAGGFDLFDLNGDHLSILDDPAVADLAQLLHRVLAHGAEGTDVRP